jgi:hypothetical protein
MAKRICLLNGENKVQDYDVNQWFSESLTPGILAPGHFAVTPQGPEDDTVNVAAGICLIEVERTADTKTFKMFAESNATEVVTVTGAGGNIGAIIAAVPKANVQDGNPNPQDGTGVFDIVYVEGVGVSPLTDGQIDSQTSDNYFWVRLADITQDATVAAGDIDFQGELPDINNVKNLDAVSITTDTITEKTADAGVTIDTWLLKDGVVVAEEITTPSTPASNNWGFYFKTDGPYVIDDNGVEYKLASGAIVPTVTAPLGEAVAAGDPLRMWIDGKAYKTSDAKDLEIDSYGTSALNISFDADSSKSWNKIASHRLDTDKWLFTWSWYDTVAANWYIQAKVGTVANGRWTFGSNVTVDVENSISSMQYDPKRGVAIISSGIAYFTWIINDAPTDYVKSRRVTISGTTITLGTENDVDTGTTGYNRSVACPVQKSGTDHIVVAYQGSSTSNQLKARCVQNTSESGEYTIETNGSGYFDLAYNDEQQVIAIYENSAANDLDARILTQTVNTTTLTLETEAGSLITGTIDYMQIEQNDVDDHLILYSDDGDNTLNVCALTVDGVTPSVGTPAIVAQGVETSTEMTSKKSGYRGRLTKFDNDVWGIVLEAINDPTAELYWAGEYYDANTDLQSGGQVFMQFAFVDYSGADPIPHVQTPIVLGYVDGTDVLYEDSEEKTPYILTADPVKRRNSNFYVTQYKIDINNFIGWADEAGVLDDEITINPLKDDNQTGLEPGRVYSLGPNGTMEIQGSGKPVGQAINATTLMRIFNSSSNYF